MTDEEWKWLMLKTPEERQQYMEKRNKCCCCLWFVVAILLFIGVSGAMKESAKQDAIEKQNPPTQSQEQPQGYKWPETTGPRP